MLAYVLSALLLFDRLFAPLSEVSGSDVPVSTDVHHGIDYGLRTWRVLQDVPC